jgi:hypothetical protein
MKLYRIVPLAGALMMAGAASASSPAAWAKLDTQVIRACIAMSGLSRPQVLAQKISTSDAVGVELRLIRGYDDRNRFHRKICVFNRKNSRTEVHDAGSWSGSTVKP